MTVLPPGAERKEFELSFSFQIKSDSAQGVAGEMV